MKMAFFELQPHEEKPIKKALAQEELFFDTSPLTSKYIPPQAKDAEIISIFVHSNLTDEVLQHFPNLKLIVTRSTGYDHIACSYAKQQQIIVCNVPMYAIATVAEYTFALLLALSRKIYKAYFRISVEHSFDLDNLCGFDLYGKTIGIIGLGNIGQRVAHIAQGFGMNILAYDKYKKESSPTYQLVDFQKLLKESDIITLHVPLTDETRYMINEETIGKMKKGAYIINTARGTLINVEALVNGIANQKIAGAGLDVLPDEDFVKNPLGLLHIDQPSEQLLKTNIANEYLLHHPRVIVTAHTAFNSCEARDRLINSTIETIMRYKEGKPIPEVA